jgi:hypothetical protein
LIYAIVNKYRPQVFYWRIVTMNETVRDARFFPAPLLVYAPISLLLLGLAFSGGYVLAQKSEEVDWLGWPVLAKPRGGPDRGIYGRRPPPEQFIQDDVVLGLREDGVVVWRRVTKPSGK